MRYDNGETARRRGGDTLTPDAINAQRVKGSEVASWDETCNTLYFPYGRRKLGGVYCRLEPGHDGDHWCEAEDEMDPTE